MLSRRGRDREAKTFEKEAAEVEEICEQRAWPTI
jgi:hypothetical protein